MQTPHTPPSRVRRTVDDLVMAEMFLVQATIESATAIGSGLSELIARRDDAPHDVRQPLSEVLLRIADEAVEPYSTRYKYFRGMLNAAD